MKINKYTIISNNFMDTFTEESMVDYLTCKYNITVLGNKIHPDVQGLGRGAIELTEEDYSKIPENWESYCCKDYYEGLQTIEE